MLLAIGGMPRPRAFRGATVIQQRERLRPTDDWQQLQLLVQFPEQRTYELIRRVVLFAHSPAERARVTSMPRSTLFRQAAAFHEQGMASFFTPLLPDKHHTLPGEIRDAILALKAGYPPLRSRELTRTCSIRFKRSISHHTVAPVLATGSFPLVLGRRYPPYHDAARGAPADPAAQHAIVQLHVDGWNAKSIAGYLATSRQTVHATLKRWIAEGGVGARRQEPRAHRRAQGRVPSGQNAGGSWRTTARSTNCRGRHRSRKSLNRFLSPPGGGSGSGASTSAT